MYTWEGVPAILISGWSHSLNRSIDCSNSHLKINPKINFILTIWLLVGYKGGKKVSVTWNFDFFFQNYDLDIVPKSKGVSLEVTNRKVEMSGILIWKRLRPLLDAPLSVRLKAKRNAVWITRNAQMHENGCSSSLATFGLRGTKFAPQRYTAFSTAL